MPRVPVKLHNVAEKFVTIEDLPNLPHNVLDWIEQARPSVGRIARNFEVTPFLREIYEDNSPNIMIVAGRQTYKTTLCTDLIANYATTNPRSEVCLVTDNENHLSAVSKQRLRIETFLQNSQLRQFLRHDRANIGEISLNNDSVIYLVTDEGEYKKVEGKSLGLLVLDETQYQDVQFLQKAMYALFQTHGRIFILGIGGEAGSEYHKLWARTDKREWIYDDPLWREKLEFDASGRIINTNLGQVLAGRWVSQDPKNTQFRSYHLPQSIYPNIPLTINDANTLYNINPEFSIEHQRRYAPKSIYESHVLGTFYKAERRPLTPEDVTNCYNRNLALLNPHEVREIKLTHGNQVRVYMGVDFGSGPSASKTVASIIIHWRKSNRYQLAWIDPRPQENQFDQARYLSELARDYDIDFGVGDLGYGQGLVKLMQDGGRDSKDRKFEALGRKRFVGCRTIGSEVKPSEQYKQDTDEHGTELGRIQIDKTTSIQAFVDFVLQWVAHPTRPTEDLWRRTQFMIPAKNDWETDFLVNDFTAITRKDLEEIQEVRVEDPRQKPKKEFNHPPDSVMSIIYCLVASNNYDESRYSIRTSRKSR